MGKDYYIASCVFTARFPELSRSIRAYAAGRGLEPVRCCVPSYKLRQFEEQMPEGGLREAWRALPDSADLRPGDRVWSLCHNCNNIIEETRPGTEVRSLWELIDGDPEFPFPDPGGKEVFVQDCWRSRGRADEQAAVRSILRKMGLRCREAREHHEKTDFCGISLYREQPPRNPKLAPKHYAEGIGDKFRPHTEEEQSALMRSYCAQFGDTPVVCYCHYCLEGLQAGGAKSRHLAEYLF